MTRASYAKINLFLHVLGKRADGYHDIYTLFYGINLHDDIEIIPAEKTNILYADNSIKIYGRNIINEVDNLLRRECGLTQHFEVRLNKRIPIGAGLGGGSSNACTYMQLVNEQAHLGLTTDDMRQLLVRLGSDTAFFLYPPMALGEGRGELLTPIKDAPRLNILMANPNIFVSTASIYGDANLKLTEKGNLPKIPERFTLDWLVSNMKNDLEQPVFMKEPLVKQLKDELLSSGALNALMSGSGSTVFGVYRDCASLDRAYDALRTKYASYKFFKCVAD
ncbi:4-(cytidine 5'-diphospho)-2-C-methyl-D-erythritol kinase [Deferribacterales bacterium RsTz2092]|nr:4-diphosphocytidyl-2-C-methyl-D-erythritol kinase [Deferribacterales bacterium]